MFTLYSNANGKDQKQIYSKCFSHLSNFKKRVNQDISNFYNVFENESYKNQTSNHFMTIVTANV